MTVTEMLTNVFSLIEEYDSTGIYKTSDADLSNKVIAIMNNIQFELARIKKISAYEEMEVEEGQQLDLTSDLDNFYQLNVIRDVQYEEVDNLIIFKESGIAKIYYYKYPTIIKSDKLTAKINLSADVIEIMTYGVASDLLKNDPSNQYGQIYANRYKELLNGLDPRYSRGHIELAGGVE